MRSDGAPFVHSNHSLASGFSRRQPLSLYRSCVIKSAVVPTILMIASRGTLTLYLLAACASARAVSCDSEVFENKHYTVCQVNLKNDRLQLYLRNDEGKIFKNFDALEKTMQAQGKKLSFAMNAGMYHPDFSPVGLYVEQGTEVASLNMADGSGNFFLKPNGVFYVFQNHAGIAETGDYSRLALHPQLATQSGPMLVQHGTVNPLFNAFSNSLRVRNAVGTVTATQLVFAISEEPVSFYEIASLFLYRYRCKDALYLDGSISSLYAPKLKRNDNRWELGPIIAVVE